MFGGLSGSSSAVERQLPKLDVTGSIPVSRSMFFNQLERRAPRAGVQQRAEFLEMMVGELRKFHLWLATKGDIGGHQRCSPTFPSNELRE